MHPELIRALTPIFLSLCGLGVFAIAAITRMDAQTMPYAMNLAAIAFGGGAGAATQNSDRKVEAQKIDKIDIE